MVVSALFRAFLCKVQPGRARFLVAFCEVFIEGFRRFSGISAFLHVFACTIERFQGVSGLKWHSFFMEFHIDPINFELKISKFHIDFVYNLAVKTKRDDVFLWCFVT